MTKWLVETHVGDFVTVAKTAKRAIANVRWRIYGAGATLWDSRTWCAKAIG